MGYVGYSMSERAVGAYDNGLLPASKLARQLGVSTAAIKAVLTPAEWHHTSSRFNRTDFYSWDSETEDEDEDERAEQAERLAAMKEFDAENKLAQSDAFRAEVRWLEWSGSRAHPHADERTATARVTQKGEWFSIEIEKPDGDHFAPFRKRETTRGFSVRKL